MSRFKLLLVAASLLVTAVSVRPVKSDTCILQGFCQPCPSPTPLTSPARPCKYNPCTGELICGTCRDHCVPPPV
jgi:hypothetical protein